MTEHTSPAPLFVTAHLSYSEIEDQFINTLDRLRYSVRILDALTEGGREQIDLILDGEPDTKIAPIKDTFDLLVNLARAAAERQDAMNAE